MQKTWPATAEHVKKVQKASKVLTKPQWGDVTHLEPTHFGHLASWTTKSSISKQLHKRLDPGTRTPNDSGQTIEKLQQAIRSSGQLDSNALEESDPWHWTLRGWMECQCQSGRAIT